MQRRNASLANVNSHGERKKDIEFKKTLKLFI